MAIVFSIAMAVMGLVAYLTTNWFQVGLVTSLPFFLLYTYWWILDESPRWLLTQDRISDLEKLVFKMAKGNGIELPEHYDVLAAASKRETDADSLATTPEDHQGPKIRFWHLLKTPNLRSKTLILTYTWIANAIVYVGLQFNVENLPGNQYLIFSTLALTEAPAACLNWLILDRVGRILPAAFSMLLGGAASVATFFLMNKIAYLEILILAACTKFCIASSYSIIYQISGELFPTEARATGIGFGSLMANVGILAMPYIIASARSIQMLPMLIMGLLSLSGGILVLFLPETLRENLPESLKQAENVGRVGAKSFKDNVRRKSVKRSRQNYLERQRNLYLDVPSRNTPRRIIVLQTSN